MDDAPPDLARTTSMIHYDVWEAAADGVTLLVLLWPIKEKQQDGGGVVGLIVIALCIVLLVVRRRQPQPAMAAALALALVGPHLDSVLPVWLTAHVCLLTLALRRPLRAVLPVAALLLVATLGSAVGLLGFSPFDLQFLGLLAWTAAVAAIGSAVRSQRDYVALVEERALRLKQTRESEVHRRITEERLRISRDLHDAVAHSITVISLHAGAAQSSLGRSEETTRSSLVHIQDAARVVLADMQEILQVLRTDDTEDSLVGQALPDGPLLGLRGVNDLVESFRATGLLVELRDRTTRSDQLEAGADAAIYRVVQEALTNARRHGTGSVGVDIADQGTSTEVRVTNARSNTTRDRRTDGVSSGFGLVGMRERVSRAHGRLDLVETATSFTLVATLPHASTSPGDEPDAARRGP